MLDDEEIADLCKMFRLCRNVEDIEEFLGKIKELLEDKDKIRKNNDGK